VEEVQSYIESGILELYVLGQLTAQENAEVEAMAAKHSIVKAEISAIESAMEAYALENAVSPSSAVGEKILAQFDIESSTRNRKKIKIVPLYENVNDVKIKVLRYALVACIAMLVVSAATLYSLYNQLSTAHQQIASLSTQKEQFVKTASKLKFDIAGMENRIAMTETSEWSTIKLAGVKNSPTAKMLVYWNKNNKNILINYAAIDLPKTDYSHVYQLWALVDGKPVSLGIFAPNEKATEAVKQMDAIQNAQAFAVTIEPTGGSVNPTMEKMVVMGAI
jgi:anti-sigma-K factor RskA